VSRLVTVVAAVLCRGDEMLVALRPEGKSLAGLWEFPGGKIEPGESPEAALVRELDEELGIGVAAEALVPLGFVSHGYADFHLLMLCYRCHRWQGEPVGRQGQPLRWGRLAELAALPMPPADAPVLAMLAGGTA